MTNEINDNMQEEKSEQSVPAESVDEMTTLQKQAEEYLTGWKRERADFQNFKKDQEKQRMVMHQMLTVSLMRELLPTLDYFESAMAHAPAGVLDTDWGKGLQHIQKEFQRVLDLNGVEVIPASGQVFSPELHEAVEEVEHEGVAAGTIIAELQKGYRCGDVVLRPSRVKVAK